MSLINMAVDGLLQRNPGIFRPILAVPTRTESTRGPYPHKPFPKPAVRSISGASQTDEFQSVRFERGPSRMTGPKPGIKTFGGYGGENAVFIEPETGVKSFNAPANYGNLPPKVPLKTFEAAEISRTPIKTF